MQVLNVTICIPTHARGHAMTKSTKALSGQDQKYILVHVNMTKNTLKKIEEVKERVRAANETTAIRYSIDLADMITNVITRGGKVILEENGCKYLLQLHGPVQNAK